MSCLGQLVLAFNTRDILEKRPVNGSSNSDQGCGIGFGAEGFLGRWCRYDCLDSDWFSIFLQVCNTEESSWSFMRWQTDFFRHFYAINRHLRSSDFSQVSKNCEQWRCIVEPGRKNISEFGRYIRVWPVHRSLTGTSACRCEMMPMCGIGKIRPIYRQYLPAMASATKLVWITASEQITVLWWLTASVIHACAEFGAEQCFILI